MSPATWMELVAGALEKIRARDIEKVVTAMHGQVLSPQPIDVAALLARMSAEYGDCVRFSFTRAGATFVGATPERLVVQSGLDVEVDALAGSARRVSPAGDDAVVMGLLASDKDRREHAHVVDAVACALLPLCRILEVPSVPRVRSLRNVHHLWSPVHATRARAGHVLELVERLHPTPAVCGTPREAALGWIATFEPMQRGWYAGAVGWFDGTGDGAFAVAIRSGVIERHRAWLYAGAGIVEGSDPEVEYAEVRTKQAPMLSALGVLP
jgi:menaquinone-specific isochorismate synthase